MVRTEVVCRNCGAHLGPRVPRRPRADGPALLHQLRLARLRGAGGGLTAALLGGLLALLVAGAAGGAPVAAARPRAATLTPAQLAGQRMVFGFSGTTPAAGAGAAHPPRRGRGGDPARVQRADAGGARALTARLQAIPRPPPLDVPLLVMIDQEGGLVRRLDGPPARRAPTRPRGAARRRAPPGGPRAASCAGVGANVDLAPVADVARPGSLLADTGRTFGCSPARVAGGGGRVLGRAARGRRASAAAKHFPGLGAATVSTDAAPVRLDRPGRRAAARRPAPFPGAHRPRLPMVMLGTAIYPALDPSRPAALSRAVTTDLLRGALGFDGRHGHRRPRHARPRAPSAAPARWRSAPRAPGSDLLIHTGYSSRRHGGGGHRRGPSAPARSRAPGPRRPSARILALRARPAMIARVAAPRPRGVTFDEALAAMRAHALALAGRAGRPRRAGGPDAGRATCARAWTTRLHQLGDGRLRGAGGRRRRRPGAAAGGGEPRRRAVRRAVGAGRGASASPPAPSCPRAPTRSCAARTPRTGARRVVRHDRRPRRDVRAPPRRGRARGAGAAGRPGTVVAPHEVAVVAAAGHAEVLVPAPPAGRGRGQRRRAGAARRAARPRARSSTPTAPASRPRPGPRAPRSSAPRSCPTTAPPPIAALGGASTARDAEPPRTCWSPSAASRWAATTTCAPRSRPSGWREVLSASRSAPATRSGWAARRPASCSACPATRSRRRSASTPSAGRCSAGADDWEPAHAAGSAYARTPRAPSSPLPRGGRRAAPAAAPGLARDHLARRRHPPRGDPRRARREPRGRAVRTSRLA